MSERRLIDANDLRAQARPASDFVKQGCGDLLVVGLGYVFDAPTVPAVVLPCAVGDTVYVIADADYQHGWKPYVLEAKVTEISWKRNRSGKDLGFAIIVERGAFCKTSNRFSFNSIGKSVFLTREAAEAAEAALAERRADDLVARWSQDSRKMDAQEGAEHDR